MRVSNNTEWLFSHLWKKNPKTKTSCPHIFLAETVLFRWSQPCFYYLTAKDGTLIRKKKEEIFLSNIAQSFSNNISKSGTVATCLNSLEDTNLKSQEKIEFSYVEKPNFKEFLLQKEKPSNFIMQKFIEPKGNKNALIKVSWTPHFCILFQKTNITEIANSKVPLINRLTTFEGPEHFSTSDTISDPDLASDLEQICLNIVKHIQVVTNGSVQISKMVLYFKIDEKNKLWLLFCTHLNLREKKLHLVSGKGIKKRAQSPVMTVTASVPKVEEKSNRRESTQDFLTGSLIYELNPEQCMKCEIEGLLFDIKMRVLLEYEEKWENLKDSIIMNTGDYDDPYKIKEADSTIKSSTNKIPPFAKKLYPNLTEENYQKLKKNSKFMNLEIKLCESCFSQTQEIQIDSSQGRTSRNSLMWGRDSYRKSGQNTPSTNQVNLESPSSYYGEDNFSRRVSQLALQEKIHSPRFSQPNIGKIGDIANRKSYRASFFASQEVREAHPKEEENLENTKKIGDSKKNLPILKIPPREDKRSTTANTQRKYYLKEGSHRPSSAWKQNSSPNKKEVSPYAFEMTVMSMTQRNTTNTQMRVTLRKPEMEKRMSVPNVGLSTQRQIYRPHGRKLTPRTSYTSLMNSIQDLKVLLTKN